VKAHSEYSLEMLVTTRQITFYHTWAIQRSTSDWLIKRKRCQSAKAHAQ